MTMRVFDHIEIDELDRRDRHLWLLAISMIVILGAGTALLMYPPVFGAPSDPNARMFQRIFVGFCALNSLFVVYLLERQVTIRRLRRRLIEEQRRNAELHAKASKDLIASLPNFAHFQDRLAMQFRRAVNSREPLSLLVVSLTPSKTSTQPGEIETALGDAVKAVLRKLRAEDSLYKVRRGVFAILLPGLPRTTADCFASRLADGLADVAGALSRFSFEMETMSYPEHAAAAHEMEQMARSRFGEQEVDDGSKVVSG